MGIYDFLDAALMFFMFLLFFLIMICALGQIGYYMFRINEHMAERRAEKIEKEQAEAEKIAKNIYGED